MKTQNNELLVMDLYSEDNTTLKHVIGVFPINPQDALPSRQLGDQQLQRTQFAKSGLEYSGNVTLP